MSCFWSIIVTSKETILSFFFNFFLIIEMEELELRELEYCLPENIDFEFFFVNLVYKFLKDIILSYDAC